MKACSKCKVEKVAAEFGRNPKNKSGLFSWCRRCMTDASKNYYLQNKDIVIEKIKKRYRENPSITIARVALWRETNKERHKITYKKWYNKNKENRKAYHKQWAVKNRDQIKDKVKRYYTANREIINGKRKIYRSNNRNVLSEKQKEYRDKNKPLIIEKKKREYKKIKNNPIQYSKALNIKKEWMKEDRKMLGSRYLKGLLIKQGLLIDAVNQYPNLLELQRLKIKTTRLLKQMT